MADHRVFTLSHIAQHNSKKDCWLAIDGRVLNVTKFLENHPGGEEVLIESAGKDVTKEFKDIGHSKAAHNWLLKYQVGVLQGYTFKDTAEADINGDSSCESQKERMTGFMVKDSGEATFAVTLQFFVPLLVAASYLTYKYLTAAA